MDCSTRWGTRRMRTFDRCLLLLLDWLSADDCARPQRSAAEGWLVQSLLRDDLSRLLDPMLLKLLQPHSARVSIRHVTVEPSSPDEHKVPLLPLLRFVPFFFARILTPFQHLSHRV